MVSPKIKKEIEKALYPGVTIRWDEKDNPTLIIPSSLQSNIDKIICDTTMICEEAGIEVVFYPDLMV